ncbi:protein ABHD11-like isoform X2 [Melitaea cinxia]|uniref:protein ABHD11-like isoform X2 n=1 Tax=Melitaea cinxia TaxID=113334 RepID=UPI001E27172A|nr:protein ABHD11-like isoform X2 [Melitaea cinxia]
MFFNAVISKNIPKLCTNTLWRQYPIITRSATTTSNTETVDLAYSSYEFTDDTSSLPPLVILHGLLGSKNNWNSMSKAIHKTTGRKSDLVSSLIVVDISPVKTSPQIFSMANLFDAMVAVSIRSGIAMSKARKLADEQLKPVIPDVNLRNFLITNLVQTNNGSYAWRVNIPALKENFQQSIATFPASLKGLQYAGPTLFIGGSLSDYIGKSDLPEIQEYFPLADLIFIEGAGHWVHSQKPEQFLEIVCKFLREK